MAKGFRFQTSSKVNWLLCKSLHPLIERSNGERISVLVDDELAPFKIFRPLIKWSNGERTLASNPVGDELAAAQKPPLPYISSTMNGLPFKSHRPPKRARTPGRPVRHICARRILLCICLYGVSRDSHRSALTCVIILYGSSSDPHSPALACALL